MLFSGTKENRALADATISRLGAEARMESARASCFKIGGYGVFVVCLGLGCGAAFLGCASIKKAQSSSEEIANILVKAISNASITTKGEVKLLPSAIVSIKPNSTVGLNPTASVKLEPSQNVVMQNTAPRLSPNREPSANTSKTRPKQPCISCNTRFGSVN
jgi:hypothetical protein